MTPLFWIALTWVLAAWAVSRLPLPQRSLTGALLLASAIPILISMGLQMGPLGALAGLAGVIATYPNIARLARALWARENVHLDARTWRYVVVPGDL